MPVIRLPDGSERQFDAPVSVADVAMDIGAGLAKAALAGNVNGTIVDMSYVMDTDSDLAIITDKSDEGLDIIRHSTAHLLAYAVKALFPEAQVTIGPVIENGFYYDFSYKRAFTPEDLEKIEAKMTELAKKDEPVTRKVMPRDEAVAYFKSINEDYKAEIIASIPANEDVSLYTEGNFTDLCRGPHVPNTGKLKAFKLMKVAGAYWRGDSNNEMLQRIYGTAWRNKDELKAYLFQLEEAEKRDHRKLGKQLNFFHMQDDAPGMVFWHPKGWALWQQIEQYMRQMFIDYGYQEVRTPSVLDKSLWEKSGHWQNYHDNMFVTASENRDYAVKPMNCPGHIQIFNNHLHSYRDLPLRLAEFGSCHRNEPSGALHGLMRVRGFTQDDAHIFCTEAQVESEVADFIKMLYKAYEDFGFKEVLVKLSTRPEKRIGSDEEWDRAEKSLANALKANDLDFEYLPGEGAFYGPKIEFTLKDSLGRLWQCGTVQLDSNLPERLGAEYVSEDNSRKRPVMLHRAIVGSMERFMGILIENHAGAMPVWLSPVQVAVLNIADAQADYVVQVVEMLKKNGIRCEFDLRNEKITYKIREHSLQKLPYLLVAGDREMQAGCVAVRTRKGEDLGSMPIEAFIERIQSDIKTKV
jgi:threonyl-tRNA synthetase